MDTSKPTFRSLSPEQVNDLIATKVMRWNKTGVFWVDEFANMTAFIAPVDTDVRKSEFNPYHCLDDCWKVEEKILSTPLNVFDSFLQQLSEIVIRDLGGMDYFQLLNRQKEVGIKTFHATAKQKCEAILRAIGEVA